ncbi:MAG: T9SS type A sorting domain-containing protein [Flavobacterium sp.]|nr:T9SS type A sorting domain-containing protein [Flavobacterium sp.]
MKKRLLIVATLLFFVNVFYTSKLQAQNQEYWREGFQSEQGSTLPTTNPTSITTTTNVDYYFSGVGGSWWGRNVYSTTGTGCPVGNNHPRFKNMGTGTFDSGALVTPVVNFGIQEFHFLRARASRTYSIWVTSDTSALTSSWTLVALLPSWANTTCADTTVVIGNATAKRLKIVTRPGLDVDIDSVYLTSVTEILPVKFTNVSASKANGLTKISWNIESEINTANYVVERSINGAIFSAIGSVTATNAGKYNYIDASSFDATNYYRIKAIDKDGSFAYSAVVFTTGDKQTASVTVYPNPITNKLVNVQISNLNKGSYNVEVFNNLGQAILAKAIQFDGGTTSLSLQLPTSVNAGLYRLSVTNGVTKIYKTISVQ